MTEQNTTTRSRVLSGMRPTGKLHLGNYMGALYNWVRLQREYECYFFIADWHALTTDYADPSMVKQNIFEVAVDFLSAGLDPEQSTIFVQSHVPQHAELHLLLSMITPVSWLERVPTYKDQQEQLREKDLATYGFLGYPLLQTADILVYQPNFVPVGQDQVSHVELTREVARRFNYFYSPKRVVTSDGNSITEPDPEKLLLPEPEVLLTPSPKLPGIDGRKMSKSYGNSILLSDSTGDVEFKMLRMSNGGQRPTSDVPGDPDICPVGDMHRLFSAPHVLTHITNGCRTATIRCDECKMMAAASINLHLHPIRERRAQLIEDQDRVWEILDAGAVRAAKRAEQTMQQVRAVTGLSRDRSGVRLNQPFQKVDLSAARNLTAFKGWWDLDIPILTRNLRERWRTDLLPSGKLLKPDADGVWITQKGQRIFVAVARQNSPDGAWVFSAKPKSYEMLVLLCWDENYYLHDFVVPQKLMLGQWIAAKKSAGKNNIDFSVEKQGDSYALHLLNPPPIDITSTESDYSVIPG